MKTNISSPPEPPSNRDDPMESISSMKIMDGACSLQTQITRQRNISYEKKR